MYVQFETKSKEQFLWWYFWCHIGSCSLYVSDHSKHTIKICKSNFFFTCRVVKSAEFGRHDMRKKKLASQFFVVYLESSETYKKQYPIWHEKYHLKNCSLDLVSNYTHILGMIYDLWPYEISLCQHEPKLIFT